MAEEEQSKEKKEELGPDVYGLRLKKLRDNCQATKVIAIVEYINMEDGQSYIACKHSDDVRIWELIGMLETIKAQYTHDFCNLEDDPDLDV